MLPVVLLLGLTACDFNDVRNPIDDLDLTIELPTINTVVNAQVVDAGTMEPIRGVTLTFDGPDGDEIVDAFSDPVNQVDAEAGVASFGIDNDRVPAENAPVEFTIVARADGYFPSTKTVAVTETGNTDVVIRLLRDAPTQPVAGTAVAQNTTAQADNSGRVAQTVTLATPPAPGTTTQARASVDIPAGSAAVTPGGTALTGRLRTDLRVFDPRQGLAALPNGAARTADGRMLPVFGAAFFRITDPQGNVAVYTRGAAGKTSAQCTGTELTISITNPSVVSAFNAGLTRVDVYAYTPADGQNVDIGGVNLQAGANAGEVQAVLCIGTGGDSNVDVGLIGNVEQGIIYTLVPQGSATNTCSLDAQLAVTNPGQAGDFTLALVGGGQFIAAGRSIPAGTTTMSLRAWLAEYSSVSIVPNLDYELVATSVAGGQTSSVTIGNPCAGAYDLGLPVLNNVQTYTIVASLACPTGQEFELKLTEQSVSAVSVSYREVGSASAPVFLNNRSVTKTVTGSSITTSGTLQLKPSTEYVFRAAFGTQGATKTVATTASGSTINVALSPSEAGLTCVRSSN